MFKLSAFYYKIIMVYFVETDANDNITARYNYTLLPHTVDDDGNILMPMVYDDASIDKRMCFVFTQPDYDSFFGKWNSVRKGEKMVLKNIIPPLRAIIFDNNNQYMNDCQIIELLYLESAVSGEYILYYRLLGQLVERNVMEKILQYYIEGNMESMTLVMNFHKEFEQKKLESEMKLMRNYSSPFFTYDDKTNQYYYNEKEGLKHIIRFEEDNVYTNDEFVFRKFGDEILNTMIKIHFSPVDIKFTKNNRIGH